MTTPTAKIQPGQQGDASSTRAFGHTYWMLNCIEMFERLAYFGLRAVVPIYIMQATEPGGLHLTAIHKGWIYMWWAILQSWLPMFTGGIADRYGYKRVLFFAICANAAGYFLMAAMPSYNGFFTGILVLATGTAFFKPALQGSLAQNMTKENSSMGWGIFYWVVNVGAVMAPVLATIILGKPHNAEGWRNLFIASGVYTAVNLLVLLTFKDVPSGADKSQSILKVFAVTIENVWPYWFRGGRFHWVRCPIGIVAALVGVGIIVLWDGHWHYGLLLFFVGGCVGTWLKDGRFTLQLRLPAFLLIMSAFWMMMFQLWDLHPNFIEDWIDSSMVAAHVPTDSWWEYGDRGLVRVPQQILLNLNAALIVALVVPISWLVRKMRTLSSMLMGMSVATVGVLVAGLTGNGWIFLLGVVFFSLGEMLTGPKKNQYLALIAPPGKKGLYLGYVNIPIGIGVGLGSMIAGVVYDNYGEKATLALKYMAANPRYVARAAQSADWSDSLEKIAPLLGIERVGAFDAAQQSLGLDHDGAAAYLKRAFRHDRGQIENLALLFLATQDQYETERDYRKQVADWFVEYLGEQDDEALKALGADLGTGTKTLGQAGIARFVHVLPKAVGKNSVEALDIIRDEMLGRGDTPANGRNDAAVIDMLWRRFGDDPDVLDNLALEYLAQGTDRLLDAVAGLPFEHDADDIGGRIEEISEKLGIGRTKAFAVLNAATGADEGEIDAALAEVSMDGGAPADRVYAYLISRPHFRFKAVASKDWGNDLGLLRELIRTDKKALAAVLAEIDEDTLTESIVGSVKGLFGGGADEGEPTPEGVDYARLAGKQDLIIKALNVRDWTRSPDLIPQVLRMNPYEARALMASEVNQSPLTNTRMLWETYNPQYWVWIPFAAIGVMAMIALAIFGHMAKKWGDMNA